MVKRNKSCVEMRKYGRGSKGKQEMEKKVYIEIVLRKRRRKV